MVFEQQDKTDLLDLINEHRHRTYKSLEEAFEGESISAMRDLIIMDTWKKLNRMSRKT